MSTTALEMRQSIAALAGPRRDADSRESMLARAARSAGISYRQAKALFYGETRDPRSSVVEKVRAAVTSKKTAHVSEAAEQAARIETIAASLEAIDESFHRQEIARLRHVAHQLRSLGRDGQVDVNGGL